MKRYCLIGIATLVGCESHVSTLAEGMFSPDALTLTADSAYWVDVEGDAVMAVPKKGGQSSKLAPVSTPSAMAAYGNQLYGVLRSGGEIVRMQMPLGSTETIVNPNGYLGVAIAVNETGIYWVVKSGLALGEVMKAPLVGGVATPVAQAQDSPGSIALDETHVYWANNGTPGPPAVMKTPLSGGTPSVVAYDDGDPLEVAVANGSVYWLNSAGEVRSLPVAGGDPLLIAEGQMGSHGLAVDCTGIYWANSRRGEVNQARIGIPGFATIAREDYVSDVALDATHVYWAAARGTVRDSPPTIGTLGTIQRQPK